MLVVHLSSCDFRAAVSWFNVSNFFIVRTAVSWFKVYNFAFIRTVEVRTADPIQLST